MAVMRPAMRPRRMPPAAMAAMAPSAPAMAPAGPMAGMNKGGMASPHERADGAAKRGHTACKMCGGGYTK
jgi:hypothetical protein